jgi:ligand-binding sensor domain-containing protein
MNFKQYQYKKIIFAALFLIMNATFSIKGRAQKVSDFIFEKYTIQNGLSQSSPLSLYQDKLGYIWVGTQAGVDRFDGYNFK